ncbi:MAG: UDP-N-acetylmuramate--L-alanine ligase [Candidatus Rifleibacteriota bacterium]
MTPRKGIHFIGIGGVGMSGLALIFLHKGYSISGSDVFDNERVAELKHLGAQIFTGHHESNLPENTEKVVVSTAIKQNNPELLKARELGLPIIHRSDLLAELFLDSEKGIAVAGCHGKTTVSSMIATILKYAEKDPTCVIGGHVNALNSNACAGSSDLFVAEADESDATFLKYFPQFAVITNIDNDHMDHYSSIDAIVKAFEVFASHANPEGALFYCADDPITRNLALPETTSSISYGINIPSDIMAENVKHHPYGSTFTLSIGGLKKADFQMAVPGRHNILNALPAIGFCLEIGLTVEQIQRGLLKFTGAGRRFEIKGEFEGVTIIDDYGHHPNEIKATLEAAQSLNARRVVVVFQPHRYSRTQFLSREFGRCFDFCDKLFITDIYAASEKPIPGVTSKVILDHMPVAHRRKVKMVKNVEDVKLHLLDYIEPGDVVLTMGAGNVTKLGPEILLSMKSRTVDFDEIPLKAAI